MQWVAVAGLSVQVMRYSLFGAESSRSFGVFDKGFRRYMRLSSLLAFGTVVMGAAIALLGVFALHTLGYHRRSIVPVTILSVLVVAAVLFFVYTRLSLLFCNAAIGARASWRAAWSDTQGHFWSIAMTHFLTNLPNLAIVISFAVASRLVSRQMSADTFAYWSAVGYAFWWTVAISSSAACSAWLYRRFSARILETR
jgi:ABC-type spermidine/putrescine transport system permease subunit II